MTASKSYIDIKKCLERALGEEGFLAIGDIYSRRFHDTLAVIEIQKDIKRSTKEEIFFTFEIGIFVDALYQHANGVMPSVANPPTPAKSHWRIRLGRLLPAQSDKWWHLHDDQDAHALCEEIVHAVRAYVLPKMQEIASSDALLRLWEEGQGQGLTEYERRSNLATLLCLFRRADEANAAIEALENAAREKPWAGVAKYTAKELRKKLNA